MESIDAAWYGCGLTSSYPSPIYIPDSRDPFGLLDEELVGFVLFA